MVLKHCSGFHEGYDSEEIMGGGLRPSPPLLNLLRVPANSSSIDVRRTVYILLE